MILDEAAETGLEGEDDDTGDVALMSPTKMETLGEIVSFVDRMQQGVAGYQPGVPCC